MKTLYLADEQATRHLGATLWTRLPGSALVFLQGDLGAGKTTLVRAYLQAGGHVGAVKSPTYTLVEEYTVNGRNICHFDLYRLAEPEEVLWLGLDDYLSKKQVCFIEWADKGGRYLPPPD